MYFFTTKSSILGIKEARHSCYLVELSVQDLASSWRTLNADGVVLVGEILDPLIGGKVEAFHHSFWF
jgi:hypothetical protein